MADFLSNPTFGLPSRTLKIAKPESGMPDETWYQYFVRISQLSAERPFSPVSLGASPFTYTAFTIGHVFITGGSGVAIVLGRSGVNLTCPENTFIPVAANDTITVTYTGLPAMTFVPSARA